MGVEDLSITNSNIMSEAESRQSQGLLAGRAALRLVGPDENSANPEDVSSDSKDSDEEPFIPDHIRLGEN